MLFAAVSFLTMVQLETVAVPLQTVLVRIGEWLPGLLAAAVLTIVGWVVATLVRNLIVRLAKSMRLDERLQKIGVLSEEAVGRHHFAGMLGVIAYALILTLFLLPALDALGLTIIAVTVQNMLQVVANIGIGPADLIARKLVYGGFIYSLPRSGKGALDPRETLRVRARSSVAIYGTAYIWTAGLMNLLLLFDIWDIARGRKA